MKKLIMAVVLCAVSTTAFCDATNYSYNYKLNCGKKYPNVDILDSDAINIAIIGKKDKEVLSEHFTGVYHMVGGVQMQNGLNVAVYAHAIDPKKFKGDKTDDMPVSAWDEFSVMYTGSGVNRSYNLLSGDDNVSCKTISYTDNSNKS
ncbi:hypothetical protein LWO97_004402 [Salmonella enterica subsp. enterica serovar Enteritidis]|nr:hypothetical protein [Salmonella enterica subsp. enterica serovar Enteritidis]